MIGHIINGLRYMIDHPIQTMAFLVPASRTTIGKNLTYAFARISVFQLGRMFMDTGEYGKILFEELKRPKGAPRPSLYKGTELQRAVGAGRAAATRSVAARIAPAARFLLLTPIRAYTTLAVITIGAGYAVGSTHVVRTAPAEKGQAGMMMGTW